MKLQGFWEEILKGRLFEPLNSKLEILWPVTMTGYLYFVSEYNIVVFPHIFSLSVAMDEASIAGLSCSVAALFILLALSLYTFMKGWQQIFGPDHPNNTNINDDVTKDLTNQPSCSNQHDNPTFENPLTNSTELNLSTKQTDKGTTIVEINSQENDTSF